MRETTPGPWEIHDGGRFGEFGDLGPSVCAVTGDNLCQPLVEFVGPADAEECEANAHLIAAAPDMLRALEGVVGHYAIEPGSPLDEMVRDAIARARGQARSGGGRSTSSRRQEPGDSPEGGTAPHRTTVRRPTPPDNAVENES